jgi:hypothetical protein
VNIEFDGGALDAIFLLPELLSQRCGRDNPSTCALLDEAHKHLTWALRSPG